MMEPQVNESASKQSRVPWSHLMLSAALCTDAGFLGGHHLTEDGSYSLQRESICSVQGSLLLCITPVTQQSSLLFCRSSCPILIPQALKCWSLTLVFCWDWWCTFRALLWCGYVIYKTSSFDSREVLHLFIHSFSNKYLWTLYVPDTSPDTAHND